MAGQLPALSGYEFTFETYLNSKQIEADVSLSSPAAGLSLLANVRLQVLSCRGRHLVGAQMPPEHLPDMLTASLQ